MLKLSILNFQFFEFLRQVLAVYLNLGEAAALETVDCDYFVHIIVEALD